jgi:hypothetical protein
MHPSPFSHNIIEMLGNNLPNPPIILGSHVAGKRFSNCMVAQIKPELAFHFRLTGMDVDRFVAFMCVKEKSPAMQSQYCGHERNVMEPGVILSIKIYHA